VQHALIHGQSALYPLVYLAVIDEFGVTPAAIVVLATIGNISSGLLQYGFAAVTRRVSRRTVLGSGGLVMGAATALQAAAASFPPFAVFNVVSRIGGSPQHPVGNALLAEQFPARRIGSAIAVHVAGGNVGTVVIGFAAALAIGTLGWQGSVLALGLAAIVVGVAILGFVREAPEDPAEAADATPVRQLYRRVLAERDLRWLFAAAVLGGGSRGLGVLNIFVPLYLAEVIGLDTATIGLMYGVLLAASVPGPLVAGWLSDRVGRKPVIIGVYLGGAASIALFVLAGSNITWLWIGIIALSVFSFVESPQLQALMADVTPRHLRDAAFSTYFALAFGVGSMWGLLYGIVVDAGGQTAGLEAVFWLMAAASIAAAAATLRIRIPPNLDHRTDVAA
jgi:MFS family permease